MEIFTSLIIVSVLTETIWERLKDVFMKNTSEAMKKTINLIGTSALGIVLVMMTDIDIFQILGLVEEDRIVSISLTGIMAGGGSNYIHRLIGKLGKTDT